MTFPKAAVINIWEAWPPFSIKMPTEIMPKSVNPGEIRLLSLETKYMSCLTSCRKTLRFGSWKIARKTSEKLGISAKLSAANRK